MRQPNPIKPRENTYKSSIESDGQLAARSRAPRRKLGGQTIHDVAAMAGVSSITVSRYFNSPEKLSEAMREKLRKIILETGFFPSEMAGRLGAGDSRVVGAVMQNSGSVNFAALVKGMSDGFENSSLQLLLANTDYSDAREERAIRAFVGWHPSALILTRDDHTQDAEAMLRLTRCPIVETWGLVPGRPFHQVGFPHADIGIQLARHFLEQGACRIRFALRSAPYDFRAQQRAKGYTEAMLSAGLTPDIDASTAVDEFEAGADILQRLVRTPVDQRPQAIIFSSDNMAAAAILQAPQLGIRFPQDCAIAGFGDAPIAERLHPSLTTMRPQPYAIGFKAAQLVLQLKALKDTDISPQLQVIPCRLVVRESSRISKV